MASSDASVRAVLARSAAIALCLAIVAGGSVLPAPHAFAQEDAGDQGDEAGNGDGEDGGEGDAEEDGEDSASSPSEALYMEPLGRLASVMGSTFFLRRLCGDGDATEWRDLMESLIEAQEPGQADRQRLVAGFNSGYRAFNSTYRSCTPAAREAAARYREEGMELARDIAARFGN